MEVVRGQEVWGVVHWENLHRIIGEVHFVFFEVLPITTGSLCAK